MKVVGGILDVHALNTSLDEKTYDIGKAHVWLHMLKQAQIPVKWHKATKKGTKVKFEIPESQEQIDQSIEQLKAYVQDLNKKYDLNMRIGTISNMPIRSV
jgi:hypothetical protein